MPLVVILALLLGPAGRPARGQSCLPSVQGSSGDPDLLSEVNEELAARGIARTASAGCPVVQVVLEPHSQGVELTLRDAHGRTSHRLVSGAVATATIIESWARQDLSLPLLASPPLSDESPTLSVSVPPEPGLNKPIETTDTHAFRLGGAVESSAATDGSLWFGMNLSGCGLRGPACIGGLLRLAFDKGVTGASDRLETGRTALDLFVGADFPIRVGRAWLSPGLALGAGWLQTRRGVEGGSSSNLQIELNRSGARANVHVLFSWPLSAQLCLSAGLHGDLLVRPHTRDFHAGSMVLAGEPLALGRLSLGIDYGGNP